MNELILACDGGATRTRAGLYDASRALLAEAEAGPCNPSEHGVASCVETLIELAQRLAPDGSLATVVGGISGGRQPTLRDAIAQALRSELRVGRTQVTDDLHPILIANAGAAPAVLAIAGTGSSVLAQSADGRSVIVGGRGRLFGDDGSAYQIAVQALRAAARAEDGMGPMTALREALLAATGCGEFSELVPWAARATKRDVAALARTVSRIAETGDSIARDCLRTQAESLATQAAAAARLLALPAEARVFFWGGVLENSDLFRSACEYALSERLPHAVAAFPALRGHRAVLELAFMKGSVPDWISQCDDQGVARQTLPRTEQRVPGRPLDTLSAVDIVSRMAAADACIPEAVQRQAGAIAETIEAVAEALRGGGRLIYVGAGTSGRLGALDAAECPPTFGAPADRVLAIIAGGDAALRHSIEGVEDDTGAARRDLAALAPPLGSIDVVVGIAASGRTPYVLAALEEARSRGAQTAILACNPVPARLVDIRIVLHTGPEVLGGSTRLKAGTATKLVLNMISTGAMALAGFVYEGQMAGIRPINAKLRERARRIVADLTGLDLADAGRVLTEAGDNISVAVIMTRKGVPRGVAEEALKKARGRLREVFE